MNRIKYPVHFLFTKKLYFRHIAISTHFFDKFLCIINKKKKYLDYGGNIWYNNYELNVNSRYVRCYGVFVFRDTAKKIMGGIAMHKIKKIAAVVAAIAAFSSVTASAEWVNSGYDTTDLNNIGKIYNEVIGGKSTSKSKFVPLENKDIKWVAEGYELAYPHAGYDRLYLEGNYQLITRYNNLFPQWETRFADYFWELYGEHRIYQRQQTNIPNRGWTWDYSDNSYVDSQLFVPTTRNAAVTTDYKWYGVGPFDYEGKLVSADVAAMYARFGVDAHEFNYNPETKEIVDGTFFSDENLSRLDANGEYVVSDAEIADHAASIISKYLTGPSYRGDAATKNVAAEYLKHGDAWEWDYDTLIYGGGQVSWTGVMYEMAEPYNIYQYLIINGIIFDGHNDLPRIYRYTGGKATPNVEWKYAFAEKAYPYNVIEYKYVDGKLAIDEVTGEPIYRMPTGEYANIYYKVTPTEVQAWLKDAHADVKIGSISRVDHDLGNYAGYVGGASWINN